MRSQIVASKEKEVVNMNEKEMVEVVIWEEKQLVNPEITEEERIFLLLEKINETELKQLEYQKCVDERFEKIFAYISEQENLMQKIF